MGSVDALPLDEAMGHPGRTGGGSAAREASRCSEDSGIRNTVSPAGTMAESELKLLMSALAPVLRFARSKPRLFPDDPCAEPFPEALPCPFLVSAIKIKFGDCSVRQIHSHPDVTLKTNTTPAKVCVLTFRIDHRDRVPVPGAGPLSVLSSASNVTAVPFTVASRLSAS